MAGSLKDQLVKAGLVSADRARKVEREVRVEQQARRRAKSPKGGGGKGAATQSAKPAPLDEAKQRALEAMREKAVRDRALAQAVADKAAAKAQRAEIRQIILQNDQRVKQAKDDDVAFNFVHGKRVKRIYLPKAQRDQIVGGTLIIVNNDGLYHLLPKKAADKVAARDPKRIIVANDGKPEEPGPDDEYYAKFKVPDDLDW